MPLLHVCIHDATPAFAREIEMMVRHLTPLIGRHLSFGVVPDWHGQWPLTSHLDFCRALGQASDELLLHGYFHHRQRGHGPVTMLAERSDEMNGLDPAATLLLLQRGQRVMTDMFGAPARGFLAPAWQRGQLRLDSPNGHGLQHVLGFFSLISMGKSIPLATSTWDCGRWSWLGHVGHGVGALLRALSGRVPVLAIHPRDLARGYWPRIMRLTQGLIDRGYEPATLARLLEARC